MLVLSALIWHTSRHDMPKPNYQFEKRRREMEKKAKKNEKRRQKLESARSSGLKRTAPPSSPVDPA